MRKPSLHEFHPVSLKSLCLTLTLPPIAYCPTVHRTISTTRCSSSKTALRIQTFNQASSNSQQSSDHKLYGCPNPTIPRISTDSTVQLPKAQILSGTQCESSVNPNSRKLPLVIRFIRCFHCPLIHLKNPKSTSKTLKYEMVVDLNIYDHENSHGVCTRHIYPVFIRVFGNQPVFFSSAPFVHIFVYSIFLRVPHLA